jgi:hypothetical protein
MTRTTQAALVLMALTGFLSKAGALNLTPLEVVVNVEGPPQHRYYFQDTDKRLGFRIDSKTTVSGSVDTATFRFTDCEGAAMRLLKSPSAPGIAYSGDGPKAYEILARALLPAGATEVELTATNPDAIAINGWTSLQFVFSYNWAGVSYTRAITFMNFSATEQFVCDISSRNGAYEKVYARSYRVLNSLFELPRIHQAGPT